MPPAFLPGIELSRLLYEDVVGHGLAADFPGLPYAAGLIGPGSEVLGYDTERSTDHDWGPRLLIFLPDDQADRTAEVRKAVGAWLPEQFRGFPTTFPEGDHRVVINGLGDWLRWRLGFDPRAGIGIRDWLGAPGQLLAEVTGGAVFHDESGELGRVRQALAWYPDDVWRYLLACQWMRISQEEPFPGRCAEVGDDVGSMIIAARLARDVIKLCLLMERRYPPYPKWLGTAFRRLPIAAEVEPLLAGALTARDWPDRERLLNQAYLAIGRAHNALGLTAPVEPALVPFHTRPFLVPEGGRYSGALIESIADPELRRLPRVGAADQYLDSTDALNDHGLRDAAAGRVLGSSAR
ncbi:DUF4037 domain-containing protein [Microlunatus sp. GCM10028923]|uniref:DUF4037 domain-containing protein n=1 Tax=Microlunatus sp. GCM10028923 TaxID=3273400 RepID=UPI0036085CA8